VGWVSRWRSRDSSGRSAPRRCGAVLGGALVAFACIATPAAATLQIKNGRIAYWAPVTDFKSQIFTRDLSGSDVQQLTQDDGTETATSPAYSPDGRTIVYSQFHKPDDGAANWDIYAMDADGTNKRPLTDTPDATEGEPSYSLDGSQIAYSMADGSGIWVMNSNGLNAHQVTDDSSINELDPAFSPDGTHIAFEAGSSNSNAGGIDVVDLNTGDITGLSHVAGGSGPLFDLFPTYSPDGTEIAFDRFSFDSTGYGEIYLMNADGSNLRPITDLPLNVEDMSWSSDGSQLIFDTYLGGFNGFDTVPGPFLYVVNSDGSSAHPLDDSHGAQGPSWQRRVLSVKGGCSGPGHPIAGASGPNLLRGTGGSDLIDAKGGNDRVLGRNGNDTLCGGPGRDLLNGGLQNDTLDGGPNRDVLDGDLGDDHIDAVDGQPDRVTCGPGTDTAQLDTVDVITDATAQHPKGSCEAVRRG
jgi:Tol biopolymer transport system component